MNFQRDIFGNEVHVGSDTRNVRDIIEKYPAAVDHPELFFWTILKHYCPATAQLAEPRQNELKAFCRDIESLRRRRQEYRAQNHA